MDFPAPLGGGAGLVSPLLGLFQKTTIKFLKCKKKWVAKRLGGYMSWVAECLFCREVSKCLGDTMSWWQNVSMTQCLGVKMSVRPNVKELKC